jgi:hypothetical protein
MTRRQEIREEEKAIFAEMDILNKRHRSLKEEDMLLCDDQQHYTEEVETWGRGKNKRQVLAGRIHWKEDFKCGDTGKLLTLDRCRVVKQDGEWIC